MIGTIYGDKAGSIYEYNQFNKKIESIYTNEFILPNSFYSDDTIETIAVIDAIINDKDYEDTLKEYILNNLDYKPNFSPYFEKPFSEKTIKWAQGEEKNDSIGNGAMMRISPVGFLFDTEQDVIKNAKLVTETSHNSDEAIAAATKIALMIYYFRNGLSKDEVYKKLNLDAIYRPFKKFNKTCNETIGNILYTFYRADSFEDSIKQTLFMGGDTDTNCAIVGSLSEAYYGVNDKQKSQAIEGLPEDYVKTLKRVYKKL